MASANAGALVAPPPGLTYGDGTWRSPGYRSSRTRARWTQLLFAVTALASLWQLVLAFTGYGIASRALGGTSPKQAELFAFVQNSDQASGLFTVCAIGLAIAFLAWRGCGARNDELRIAIAQRFGPDAVVQAAAPYRDGFVQTLEQELRLLGRGGYPIEDPDGPIRPWLILLGAMERDVKPGLIRRLFGR